MYRIQCTLNSKNEVIDAPRNIGRIFSGRLLIHEVSSSDDVSWEPGDTSSPGEGRSTTEPGMSQVIKWADPVPASHWLPGLNTGL